VADHLPGVPVEDHDQVDPTKALDMTLVMSMPPQSFGRVGRGSLVSTLRFARSFGFGFTGRSFVLMTPQMRFWLTIRPSTSRSGARPADNSRIDARP
jgi:hypothetical protein